MTKILEIYKCNVCGNIIEVIHTGEGKLVCCGKTMELQNPKTQDEGSEKHVPAIEKIDSATLIKVGEIPHPMEENHFIEWIEVEKNGRAIRKFLKPGEEPKAEFCMKREVNAKIYCNIHGLWKNN